MPKRKPPRSRRKRGRQPLAPPTAAPPVRPAGPPLAIGTPAAPQHAREPSVTTRFSGRDYSYVGRELRRIVLLASAIIIVIVVLSFFLP